MTVLIISSVPDLHARAVMAALARAGHHAELLDLAEFPLELALSMEYADGARRFRLKRKDGGALDLETVTSVWWRRPRPFTMPPGIKDPPAQRYVATETATAFQGLYQSMNARWINDPERDRVASHKSFQLTVAQEIGLEIPHTLITNDPEAARAFWREHPGEVIHKQFITAPETWRETRRLSQDDQTLASSIVYAPVLFQRHVRAVADLRVTAIGGKLFTGATDVSGADYPQDVRMNLSTRYTAHELPAEVAAKIHMLMRRLGLVYGALDFRLTPEGRYVFLEINPAGQFLYIEDNTRQPIAAALADELAAR